MKLGRRRSPLLFLLLTILLPGNARSTNGEDLSATTPLRSAGGSSADPVIEAAALPETKANPVGTKDAPVDGKDGKPHEGPFVETGAERDRKKTKGSTDEEPASRSSTKEQGRGGELPLSNDGVMDDPNRLGPKDGTRGVEGGVTEKSKDTKVMDKIPDPPKEVPPLPHSEQEKIKTQEGKDVLTPSEDEKKLLEKPDDLPDKPHNIPPPYNPSSPKDPSIMPGEKSSASTRPSFPISDEPSAVIQPLHSLFLSFTMIMFSEIGDKTFLVAALMAMRHPRTVVFSAAYSALIAMTVLSAILGHAVPTLIPKSITNFAAAGLFLVFGVKMLLEARNMSPEEGISEEMKEVEMELEEKEHQQRRMSRRRSSISPYVLEAGRGVRKARPTSSRLPSPPDSPSPSSSRGSSPSRHSNLSNLLAGVNNLFSLLLSPAWVQTFVMTFFGEWGDRSQIATIAMAAGQDYWWVTGGALIGHAICTAAAVMGGRAIAGRVSLKVVTMGGAIAFLVFGFIYLFEAIY